MISIKSDRQIQKMIEAGKVVSQVLNAIAREAKIGVTTAYLDRLAEKLILEAGARPSFKNYNGFKFSTCISIDDAVVHGFPSDRPLKSGEILSIDVGACLDGFHADAARTIPIGNVSSDKLKLIEVTKQSFYEGLKYCRSGNKLGQVSNSIQTYVQRYGYGIVRSLCGHGIGKKLHEGPQIPNYGEPTDGPILRKGYALAIEPMINMGSEQVYTDKDGWTVRTQDGLVSAHYENTVIITDSDPIITTSTDDF
ncbi:MAG: type I methionyl aminopeptidase [Firmicutes bacterium]|nr:type I methionyl aminopeptidase [Bacillota bacterium]